VGNDPGVSGGSRVAAADRADLTCGGTVLAQLKLGRRTQARPSQVEQRGSPRKQVNLAAKVVLGDAAGDCTIRDISETGAQVHAPSVLRLPGEVHLLIMSEGLLIHARRVWSRFPVSGLQFISAEEIEKSTHPQSAMLKEAWEASQAWRAPRARRDLAAG
jgi:hypothetical protein